MDWGLEWCEVGSHFDGRLSILGFLLPFDSRLCLPLFTWIAFTDYVIIFIIATSTTDYRPTDHRLSPRPTTDLLPP